MGSFWKPARQLRRLTCADKLLRSMELIEEGVLLLRTKIPT